MTRLITFTDDNMTTAADICVASALQNNVHETKIYRPKDIDAKFRKANASILDQPRGCGYWLWKPYLIDRELKRMKEGEILIYCDAGVEIINNVNHIIDRMAGDIFLFGNMFKHVHWCKADVIVTINDDWHNNPFAGYSQQVQASVLFIRNAEKARVFVKEWMGVCTIRGLIDDSQSNFPNHPEFQEHRHDQAILTTLAYRERITPFHWWPAMYNAGNFTYEKTGYNDAYPVLFHHHRMRNSDFTATDDLNRHMQKYFKSKYSFV
jgi:hypothetical protein